MSDWQPIDTAPSEKWVLCHAPSWACPEVLVYTEVFFGPRQRRMAWRDDSCDSYQDYAPTHWMPLPSPPTA